MTSTDSAEATRSVEILDPPAAPARRSVGLRERWGDAPLRARLLAILVVLLVAALFVTGLGTTYALRSYLIHKVDDQLVSSVEPVLRYAATRGIGDDDRPGGPLASYALQASFDSGQTPNTDSPRDRPAPDFEPLTNAQAAALKGRPFTVDSVSGSTQWRVIAVPMPSGPYQLEGQQSGSVQIALPIDGATEAADRLIVIVIGFGVAVALFCVLLGWLAIRRAFLPLTEVEQTAAAIAAGDLSRRIPEHPPSTEVGRLTTSLNGMLAQIETAFRAREASEQRTRRFAADASHELRTPLASIRGFAELYRQGAVREPDDVGRTMSRIEDESRRMGALVEDLLLLARLDEQRPARTDPVDLAVLAGDAVHDARGLAPDRGVKLVGLGGRGPEPAVVIGDENRLRQVVANLVGNAARHTPAGTPIEVAVGNVAGKAVLEVRDHGPGLPPEHAAKVFERFYRVDSSRTRGSGGGSGLGLSIVAAVISAHGGRVGVAPTPGGGATFRVELAPAPPQPEPIEDDDPNL